MFIRVPARHSLFGFIVTRSIKYKNLRLFKRKTNLLPLHHILVEQVKPSSVRCRQVIGSTAVEKTKRMATFNKQSAPQKTNTFIDAEARDKALQHVWLPSDYFPLACSICGRRPLNLLVMEMRAQYVASIVNAQSNDDGEQKPQRTFNSIWNDPKFELVSECCRKEIADFEPLDVHIQSYNRVNSELPPDYSMDEFVQMNNTRLGTGRAVPTPFPGTTSEFYEQ